MASIPIPGLREVPFIPEVGMRYLSIQVDGKTPIGHICSVLMQRGFTPELVQIRRGDGIIEIHVLAWSGLMEFSPPDISDRADKLLDYFAPEVIRHAWQRSPLPFSPESEYSFGVNQENY